MVIVINSRVYPRVFSIEDSKHLQSLLLVYNLSKLLLVHIFLGHCLPKPVLLNLPITHLLVRSNLLMNVAKVLWCLESMTPISMLISYHSSNLLESSVGIGIKPSINRNSFLWSQSQTYGLCPFCVIIIVKVLF